MGMFKQEIRDLISDNKVNRAIDKIKALPDGYIDKDTLNELTSYQQRLKKLKRQVRLNIIASDKANQEESSILFSLLEMVGDLPDNFGEAPMVKEDTSFDLPDDISGGNTADGEPSITKILFLAANPTDTGKLRLGEEVREIGEGLRLSKHRDLFKLTSRFAVRPKDLSRAMLDEEPQIIHFSGHGVIQNASAADAPQGSRQLEFEPDDEIDNDSLEGYTGGVALEDRNGKAKIVSATALASLFELFGEKIKCVFLNACYSDAQANAIIEHVPYVVGMNTAVPDETAIAFATGFYDALGAGKDIPFAFKLAKTNIQLEGLPGAEIPQLRKKGE